MSTDLSGEQQLVPGYLLYPTSGGEWRCVRPDGRFLSVRGDEDVLRRAQALLAESAAATIPDDVRSFLTEITAIGVRAPRMERNNRHLVVVDSAGHEDGNPVAELVTTLLRQHANVVRSSVTDDLLAEADVLVSCAGWLPDGYWQELDRRCAEAKVAWHRCYLDQGRVRVGPMTVPRRGVRYLDARARRLAASPVPGHLRELWEFLGNAKNLPPSPWPDPASSTIAASLLVADVLAFFEGRRPPGSGCEQAVSGGEITRHAVVPLPGDAETDVERMRPSVLIDSRFGVITRVRREHTPDNAPRQFVSYTAEVANTKEFAAWTADSVAGGAALGDPDKARAAAVGEAVERYCGNAVPLDLITGSAASLSEQGMTVLDPSGFALYSDRQYATAGFPFVPLTTELVTAWAAGKDMATGHEVLVPAAMTYLNGPGSSPKHPPALINQAFAGIATGISRRAAEQAALEELIERDAVTIWWSTGVPAKALDVATDPALAGVAAGAEAGGLSLTFLNIPCTFGVPVVGVFLEDKEHEVVAFGSACRSTPAAAAEKALCEALVTHAVARELADPGSTFWTAVGSGRIAAHPYRPWRADRQYRQEIRDDWRDLTDLDTNVQLYLDPAMQGPSLRRLREPEGRVGLNAFPEVAGDPRDAYLQALAAQEMRAAVVDLTTSDVAATGLCVVRVIVPGLYQLSPAAFPLLGGTRLYTEPVARGWLPGPLTEQDIVRDPLPFA